MNIFGDILGGTLTGFLIGFIYAKWTKAFIYTLFVLVTLTIIGIVWFGQSAFSGSDFDWGDFIVQFISFLIILHFGKKAGRRVKH